jgi:hypothetical protein
MEDLSPELAGLKEEIEDAANVDAEVKESVPSTEADESNPATDMAMGAMSKAKAVMAGLEDREDGVTDEPMEEVSLEEMTDASAPVDSEPAGESINFESAPTPEPEAPRFEAEEIMAAQQAYGLSSKVAQMLPAEYEAWLFPALGHPGYHQGQLCLARVIANLASAGYNTVSLDEDAVVFPRKIQIAAATWSQTHYRGLDLEATRQDLTMAPAAEIVNLIPATDMITADLVSSPYPPMVPDSPEVITVSKGNSWATPVVVGISGISSVVIPILLMRRWTKV